MEKNREENLKDFVVVLLSFSPLPFSVTRFS